MSFYLQEVKPFDKNIEGIAFLDRDGTLNEDSSGYTYKIESFKLLEWVIPGLRILKNFNFGFAIVTNQSGVGRNYFTKYEFENFNRYLLEVLVKNGIEVNYISACFHNPELESCECRKPNLKMITSVRSYTNTKNCILIGNSDSDKLAATEAKIAYMDCNSPTILEELQIWLMDRNDL